MGSLCIPSKRTRGRSRNICLHEVKGTILVQPRPQTRRQAERQISGSLEVTRREVRTESAASMKSNRRGPAERHRTPGEPHHRRQQRALEGSPSHQGASGTALTSWAVARSGAGWAFCDLSMGTGVRPAPGTNVEAPAHEGELLQCAQVQVTGHDPAENVHHDLQGQSWGGQQKDMLTKGCHMNESPD